MATETKKRDYDREVDQHFGPQRQCSRCQRTGIITGTDCEGYEYGFRCCFCRVAEIRGLCADIPVWQMHYETMFKTMRFETVIIYAGKAGTKQRLENAGIKIEVDESTRNDRPNSRADLGY